MMSLSYEMKLKEVEWMKSKEVEWIKKIMMI